MSLHAQYGCGLSSPENWKNFDCSPSLRLQRIPLMGKAFRSWMNVKFPKEVRVGDIRKGLPLPLGSCDGVYCSHVLEHLSYQDFSIALENTYKLLRKGGVFRLVMPDLEHFILEYQKNKESNSLASVDFMRQTLLRSEGRPKGFRSFFNQAIGNSDHLWLWDARSTIQLLEKAGFSSIRECAIHDSDDPAFTEVEDPDRFVNAVAIEAIR